MFLQSNKNLSLKDFLPFIAFAILFFVAQCFVTLYPGDDTYFYETLKSGDYNLFSFIGMRYATWSGRVSSEFLIGLFTLLPLWIWRILNTIIATIFLLNLTYITCLPLNNLSQRNIFFILGNFICLSFFIIPVSVTTRACSWFTGSFFYLWPTLALLVALIPFLKMMYRKNVTKIDYFLAFIGAMIAAYMEQTAAVLLCFSAISFIYLLLVEKEFHKLLLTEILFALANFMVYQLAPGNALRFAAETTTWYPEFDTLSLMDKILNGVNWTHTHLVKEATWLMLTLSLLAFTLALPKLTSIVSKAIAFIPSLYFIGALIPFNNLTARTTSYEYAFDIQSVMDLIFFKAFDGTLPALFSLGIIILLGLLIIVALGVHIDGFICIILYLALLASGYVLGLSPTIFASGPRIFFMSNILTVVIATILLRNILTQLKHNGLLWKISYIFYTSLSTIFMVIYIGGLAVKTIFKVD